ncbi:hypothetical protein CYMTET_41662 [Cymbomonas tetramitiformis]|uniref:NHR domain-containing protein n=1 Tax=Cymbomonas tetramitiformis TaxID=36881 RepID=A0AAE0F2A5_9CHLO|nr:hypothetical protein CYMTET_41662 [Cymbomonas tetramitiformis]
MRQRMIASSSLQRRQMHALPTSELATDGATIALVHPSAVSPAARTSTRVTLTGCGAKTVAFCSPFFLFRGHSYSKTHFDIERAHTDAVRMTVAFVHSFFFSRLPH